MINEKTKEIADNSCVKEWATAYEQKYGRKPSESAMRIIDHIVKTGDILHDIGWNDALRGESARSAEWFSALTAAAFRLDMAKDQETIQAVAKLWLDDYMDGYRGGGAE